MTDDTKVLVAWLKYKARREKAEFLFQAAAFHERAADALTRMAEEWDMLQADFNDCNSERARWRARAEQAEAALAEALSTTPMAYAWTLFSGASVIKRRLTWTKDDPFAGSDVYGDMYQVVGVPLYAARAALEAKS